MPLQPKETSAQLLLGKTCEWLDQLEPTTPFTASPQTVAEIKSRLTEVLPHLARYFTTQPKDYLDNQVNGAFIEALIFAIALKLPIPESCSAKFRNSWPIQATIGQELILLYLHNYPKLDARDWVQIVGLKALNAAIIGNMDKPNEKTTDRETTILQEAGKLLAKQKIEQAINEQRQARSP